MTQPTDQFGAPGRDVFGTPGRPRADYADAEARAAQNLPIDQWGRYRIPSADGIQPAVSKGRTRVSTTKGVGQDQSRLVERTERLIVKGLAADPALAARAAEALKLEDDSKAQRKALAAVASAAFVAAGGDDRRDQGTEVHQLIDDILKGNAPEVPEKYQRDVAAYFDALKTFDLEPVPGLSEIVVLCPFEHGGAIDNIMRWWNPDTEMYELVVVDTKTGRTLEHSRVEFLSQTWFYSNALYSFVVTGMDRDKDGKITAVRGYVEQLPMELRRDKAIIIHLPMDGTAEAVLLDLSGWDRIVAAQVAIRQANAEAKYRYRSLGVIRPEAFIQPSNWAERGALDPKAHADLADQQAYDYAAQTISPEFAAALAPDHQPPPPISVLVDAVIQGLHIETSADPLSKHLAGTIRHTEQLGQPGTTPIDMTAGQFNGPPVAAEAPPVERDPVTGRKKRTCGFCHHPGHTQKSCPEKPASGKYVPPVEHLSAEESAQLIEAATAQVVNPRLAALDGVRIPIGTGWTPPAGELLSDYEMIPQDDGSTIARRRPVPAGEPEPQNNCDHLQDGDWHPYVPGQCDPAAIEQAAADMHDPTRTPPWCQLAHAHTWTSSHPDAPGQWVCSVSGKPGKAAWEAGQTAVTNQGPFYGAPQDASSTPPDVEIQIGGRTITDPVAVAAIQQTHERYPEGVPVPHPAAWPPPSLLELVALAPTQSAVLALRQEHLNAGTWTPEHDAAGMARYQELAPR